MSETQFDETTFTALLDHFDGFITGLNDKIIATELAVQTLKDERKHYRQRLSGLFGNGVGRPLGKSGVKLSPETIGEIKAATGTVREIAVRFDVSEAAVRRHNHAHMPRQ